MSHAHAGQDQRLNRGEVPIPRAGLDALIKRNAEAGRLAFTTDAAAGVAHGLFQQLIAVGTPPDNEDGSADLRYVLAVARTIGQHLDQYRIVIDKSTVPVGTADKGTGNRQGAGGAPCDRRVRRRVESRVPKEGAAIGDFIEAMGGDRHR